MSTWIEGIFVGLAWMSHEYIIDTNKGMIGTHSIKRMIDEQYWDIDMIESIKTVLWRSFLHNYDHGILTYISCDLEKSGSEDEDKTQVIVDEE